MNQNGRVYWRTAYSELPPKDGAPPRWGEQGARGLMRRVAAVNLALHRDKPGVGAMSYDAAASNSRFIGHGITFHVVWYVSSNGVPMCHSPRKNSGISGSRSPTATGST